MNKESGREIMIGLEIHVELDTKTKLFCSCPRTGDEKPNSRVCPICLGHPGSKPKVNGRAIEFGAKLALALGSTLAKEVIFSRKSYFYPDMSKNYQITQYEIPLGSEGHLDIGEKKIGLTRVHLEEDPASLVHPGGLGSASMVLVDYNRSGNPLCEIVTKPEISSPAEAREFMKRLSTVLGYLGVFDQKTCIMKADANISIKEKDFTRVEIKNISGFKEIEDALTYEIARQKQQEVHRETRAYDAAKGITFPLRKKESEEDYGYIIDPDLVPITLGKEMVHHLMKEMPELPGEKYRRYVHDFKLSPDDAYVITNEPVLTRMFENAVKKVDPILAAKWIRREIMRVLNYNRIELEDMKINEKEFLHLLALIQDRKTTDKIAQKILERMAVEDIDVAEYIKKEGLHAVSDSGSLEKFCKEVLAENPKVVEDLKSGKDVALNFLVGQVMRKSQGKADAKVVREMLKGMV